MNCPDCGNPVEKDAKFCPKCFARIEPPGFLRRLASFFQNLTKPGPHVLKFKTRVTIATLDKDGNRHEYHSVDEAPVEMRSQIETLESEAMKEQVNPLSAETLAQAAGKPGIISKLTVSIFKSKDASGRERIYHSLDELPPEIRAAVEAAKKKRD
jgi:hypothetical protein